MVDDDKSDASETLSALKWPARWTMLGLWAERITHAFWPFWAVALSVWACFSLFLLDLRSPEGFWAGVVVCALAGVGALVYGLHQFRRPLYGEALLRIDRQMPGRPVTSALEHQAVGTQDAASRQIWEMHKARIHEQIKRAKAVRPDLRVSDRDPYALRFIACLLFLISVSFGALWRSGSDELASGPAQVGEPSGPNWEVWIEPPAYTDKPGLYLNAVETSDLTVPKGSELTVRLYGQAGDAVLTETVSQQPQPKQKGAQEPAKNTQAFSREIVQSGVIRIDDGGSSEWNITVSPDHPPLITATGDIERTINGEMKLPFSASDDYGVERGSATIALDLSRVQRKFGLSVEPEAADPIVLDLPMPLAGGRKDFTEVLIENLAEHPWAGLPVSVELAVRDNAGQQSVPRTIQTILPGRRFFQPIAKAVIEQRRALLWSRKNAAQVAQLLRAISHKPEGFFPSEQAYLMLRMAITRLEIAHEFGIIEDKRDDVADLLWRTALLLEDGTLSNARERLKRAQERLSDAMKEGASGTEIAELMQELREATQDYLEQLAQQQQQDNANQHAENQQESKEITQDQLQQMMNEIQRLMEQGEMEQAQQLLAMLMEMMQNIQTAEGQGQGQGQGTSSSGPGQQAMEQLQNSLRDQQRLSDEAFQELQNQYGENGSPTTEQNQSSGQAPGQGSGRSGGGGRAGETQDQPDAGSGQKGQAQTPGSLAERQKTLREGIEGQQSGEDAADEAVDRAAQAMEQAEKALEQGDIADALGAQSDAIEALREGVRNLGEAMAQNRPEQDQQPGGETENAQQGQGAGAGQRRDPLGRTLGQNGATDTQQKMLENEAARLKSRDLLDEIRRRSGQHNRPEVEREYLKRLLDRF